MIIIFNKHYTEYENEKSLFIILSNASLFHCEVTWKKKEKKTLLINVCESLATQCILSNMDISLFSIGVDQPKPDLLIKFLPNDRIKPF